MAHGDTDLLKRVVAQLARTNGTWAVDVGFQPGIVILAIASRATIKDKIVGIDLPLPLDAVNSLIEKIQGAMIDAEKKRQ